MGLGPADLSTRMLLTDSLGSVTTISMLSVLIIVELNVGDNKISSGPEVKSPWLISSFSTSFRDIDLGEMKELE